MHACILCTRYKSMNAETPTNEITFYFYPFSWNASSLKAAWGGTLHPQKLLPSEI